MTTKPKRKTKPTQVYVDLNEILESIEHSIDSLADKEQVLRDTTGSLARSLEQVKAEGRNWRLVSAACAILAIIDTIWLALK